MRYDITVPAYAKVNLFLRVVGRRPDGYHLIESLVAFADIHDTVGVRRARGLDLKIEGPFASDLGDPIVENLVLRAAEALRSTYAIRDGADILLTKNLPVASGIGGGSADAAAALTALCRLWNIGASAEQLAEIGLGLGADVPVCLTGSPSLMSGIGETITPFAPLPPCGILLVNSGVAVSTASVFRARTAPFSVCGTYDSNMVDNLNDAHGLAALLALHDNDLAAPASALAPEIPATLRAIEDTQGCLLARMSGSGATCFGLYANAVSAADAAAHVALDHPDWWVAPGSLRD